MNDEEFDVPLDEAILTLAKTTGEALNEVRDRIDALEAASALNAKHRLTILELRVADLFEKIFEADKS